MGDNIWLSDEVKMCPHLLKNENFSSACSSLEREIRSIERIVIYPVKGAKRGENVKL